MKQISSALTPDQLQRQQDGQHAVQPVQSPVQQQQMQMQQQQMQVPEPMPGQAASALQPRALSDGLEDFLECDELEDVLEGSECSGSSGEELDDDDDDDDDDDEERSAPHAGSSQGGHGGDELPLPNSPAWTPDHTFKVLLVGDSGVGKTCIVMRFIADKFESQLPSTVGVDFAIKRMVVGDTNIKLTIWDTAGQERFRALTSTFYRGAVGIIFVYDVTRRETLSSLSGSWMQELATYDPHPEVARMVVANKVDQHDSRQVTWQEGADFAKQHGCLFVETSAKHNIAVGVAFEELVLRILDTPALLAAVAAEEQKDSGVNLAAAQPGGSGMAISCSC